MEKQIKPMLTWDFDIVRIGCGAIIEVPCDPDTDKYQRSKKLVQTSSVIGFDIDKKQIETLNTIYQG